MIKITFIVLILFCKSVFAQESQSLNAAFNEISSMAIKLSEINAEISEYNITASEKGLRDILSVTADYASYFSCATQTIAVFRFISPENREAASQMLCKAYQSKNDRWKNNHTIFYAGYMQLMLQSSLHKADKAKTLIDKAEQLNIRYNNLFCKRQWR
jgi:hypothetical protein